MIWDDDRPGNGRSWRWTPRARRVLLVLIYLIAVGWGIWKTRHIAG